MSKMIVTTIAALLVASAAPAFAADVATKTLSTASVDFHNAAATKAFYNKLARTAASVCDSNSANPVINQQDRACAKQALANAVAQLAQPTVTALYNNARDKGEVQFAAR